MKRIIIILILLLNKPCFGRGTDSTDIKWKISAGVFNNYHVLDFHSLIWDLGVEVGVYKNKHWFNFGVGGNVENKVINDWIWNLNYEFYPWGNEKEFKFFGEVNNTFKIHYYNYTTPSNSPNPGVVVKANNVMLETTLGMGLNTNLTDNLAFKMSCGFGLENQLYFIGLALSDIVLTPRLQLVYRI